MISFKYAPMLRAMDVDAAALRERFEPDIKDPELLTRLRATNYVFVSQDRRQTTRTIEARLLKQANVTAIYLGPFWSKMKIWQQAAWLITRWPVIDTFSRTVVRGTVAEVKQNGRIETFQF
jgi:PIN like domain